MRDLALNMQDVSPPRTPKTSAVPKQMSPPPSMLRRLSNFLPFSRKSPVKESFNEDVPEEPADSVDPEEDEEEEVEHGEIIGSRDGGKDTSSNDQHSNEEGAIPEIPTEEAEIDPADEVEFSKPSPSPVPEPRRAPKRKVVERLDVYDINAEVAREEKTASGPRMTPKRRRIVPKAKKPIVQWKEASTAMADEHVKSIEPEPSTEASLGKTKSEKPIPHVKKRPGRPRKVPFPGDDGIPSTSLPPATRHNSSTRQTSLRRGRSSKTVPEEDAPIAISSPHNSSEAIEQFDPGEIIGEPDQVTAQLLVSRTSPILANEGDTSLYMKPSPKKVAPSVPRTRSHLSNGAGKEPVYRSSPIAENTRSNGASKPKPTQIPELSDDSDDVSDDEPASEDRIDENDPGWLVETKYLLDMLEVVNRVGTHRPAGDGERILVVTKSYAKKLFTTNGQTLENHLRQVRVGYRDVRRAKRSGDEDHVTKAIKTLKKATEDYMDEVENIMSSRLRDPENPDDEESLDEPKRTRNILRDLYFHGIPGFVEIIKINAAIYPLHKSTSTEALQELLNLVEIGSKLCIEVRAIPETHQPSSLVSKLKDKYRNPELPASVQQYQLLDPPRKLIPRLLKIKKAIQSQIDERHKRADEIGRAERRRAKEAERQERQRIELQQRKQKIREIHRQQRAELQERLRDPLAFLVCDRIEDQIQSSRAENIPHGHPGIVEIEDDAGVARVVGEDEVERISVFGSNNVNPVSRPPNFSVEEKHIFVDHMRHDDSKFPRGSQLTNF